MDQAQQELWGVHGCQEASQKDDGGKEVQRSAARKAVNDEKSPLLNLISCVVCNQTMRLEKIDPDEVVR
jgi:hypothetical protein